MTTPQETIQALIDSHKRDTKGECDTQCDIILGMEAARDAVAAIAAQPDAWHDAVLNECMRVESCYQSDDPVKTIASLIDWHIKAAQPEHQEPDFIPSGYADETEWLRQKVSDMQATIKAHQVVLAERDKQISKLSQPEQPKFKSACNNYGACGCKEPCDKPAAQSILDVPQGWQFSNPGPSDFLTDEANAKKRIHVSRLEKPFCDESGMRHWSGPTLEAALQTACAALKLPYPFKAAQPEQQGQAHRYATDLAVYMARKFYPEVTQFKPLPDLVGVISQIDNMTTGLVREQPTCNDCGKPSPAGSVHTCLPQVEQSLWQPIDTAPRDGQNILIRFGIDGISQAKYLRGFPRPWKFIDTKDGISWLINYSIDGTGGPSHWMPLPAAPVAQSKQGGPPQVEQSAVVVSKEDLLAVGAIVHGDGNIFLTNVDKLNRAVALAQSKQGGKNEIQ